MSFLLRPFRSSPPQLPVVFTARAMATSSLPRDPNTLANYNHWLTKHTRAEFTINFKDQKLAGNVTLHLESTTANEAEEIVLDTSYLDINGVTIDGTPVTWEVQERSEPYGSPLSIKIPGGQPKGEIIKVNIVLLTTSNCTALQWLTPAQTKGEHPYVFSQCQAIHNRSLFPCQDTPDVKSTYEFLIRSPLRVVASGLLVETPDVPVGEDKLYHFEQKIPMASYLFALASGDIASASIGPRSVVATGPNDLAGAKWELENDTEKFIEIAEKLISPYAWGQYNVLVLPPSFPYGINCYLSYLLVSY